MSEYPRRLGSGTRLVLGVAVAMVLVGSLVGSVGPAGSGVGASPGSTPALVPATAPPLTISSLVISPNPVSQGSSFSVSVQVSGGDPPYSFSWGALPGGCSPGNTSNWQCSISSPGQYTVSVTVTDSGSNRTSDSQQFTVTSSGGNGQGNGHNGSSGGNGSNGFNLSSFGPILFYALIAGLVGFVLLIALTVGVIMIAVILARRLPRQPRGKLVCGACQNRLAPGSKFCSNCAAPVAPTK